MSKPASFGQSVYRLTVMAGTLFVVSMAAYLYGPPAERVADLMNMTIAKVSEFVDRVDEHRDSIPATANSEGFVAQNSSEPPIFAPAASQSTLELTPVADTYPSPTIDHTEPLRLAGATQATVTPWGNNNSLYRAAAKIPVSPGGLTRQLDAIAETPEEAVQAVLAQLNP